ncbi:condensation domain-containing protein [Nocardia otitidiscaviarum]|uniref:condensation domain-containing protein n=1 Tax=Nocardia otitidiscaviarum TaxID=1823 RepID=UPI00245849C3|nr:condensation domain-containing protein [Nocardia otitidiscaviarum]
MHHTRPPLTEIHSAAGFRDVLFDTVLAFESYPTDAEGLSAASAAVDGIAGSGLEVTGTAHYPLTVVVDPGRELGVTIGYRREFLDADQVSELSATMRALLTAVARDPSTPIEELA